MNKHAVIISGGTIDEAFLLAQLEEIKSECVIGADRGAEVLYRNKIMPNLIVGDFDSVSQDIIQHYRSETKVKIREFNPVKDASDTEIAVKEAISMGADRISIFGATGTRIDHVWANVQLLYQPFMDGIQAEIIDRYNRIRMIGGTTVLERKTAFGPFFSVFPLGGVIEHFYIKGAKYPLHDHTLVPYDSLCVSNEFADDTVEISFPRGIVILMETRDV